MKKSDSFLSSFPASIGSNKIEKRREHEYV